MDAGLKLAASVDRVPRTAFGVRFLCGLITPDGSLSLAHPGLVFAHTFGVRKPQPGRAGRKLAKGWSAATTLVVGRQMVAPRTGARSNLDSSASEEGISAGLN